MRLSAALLLALTPTFASTGAQPTQQPTPAKIALSKPSDTDGFTDIRALEEHIDYLSSKYAHALGNYDQNTGTKHPLVGSDRGRRASGAVPLKNNQNFSWYGEISVGTPPQTFIIFDTGSGDFWLPGSRCKSGNCKGHALYNPNKSSTASYESGTFQLDSGVGADVKRDVYRDTVTLGGVKISHQEIGVAKTYPRRLRKANFITDGILGLGFSESAEYTQSPVIQTMQQGQLGSPVFAFKLLASGAKLDVGGIDSSTYTGDIVYVPVTTLFGSWQVRVENLTANDESYASYFTAVVANGASAIFEPPVK
ncbi:acid protease [Coniophora puteana RWD-64-598 SS2]|uniref:Acid protease n=1 Tax=Coniophora puteana (strain RWD-64-598) TaxID=741705 RepID=A0A5M3N3R8_CONPW|nr:acid protease [Coniophora puteana RWD-64-598 SS2]EIW85996.1 acid protease [Coniophora puteana RWD-64-598 SS2]